MKIKQTQNIICIFNVSRETYVVKYEIQKSNQKMKKRNKKINLKKQKETCYSEKPNSMQKRRKEG